MANYKKMYTLLFNAATDALGYLHDGETIEAEFTLKKAQVECEQLYITTADNTVVVSRAIDTAKK